MKPVENITFETTLKQNRTIFQNGQDTHIMQILPVGYVSQVIPFDVEITFNKKPTNIILSNSIDDTKIDESYVYIREDKKYMYDMKGNYDRRSFPGKLTFPVWIMGFKYYYTHHALVNFTIEYKIDNQPLKYSFIVQNIKEWQVGDYMLSNKERGLV